MNWHRLGSSSLRRLSKPRKRLHYLLRQHLRTLSVRFDWRSRTLMTGNMMPRPCRTFCINASCTLRWRDCRPTSNESALPPFFLRVMQRCGSGPSTQVPGFSLCLGVCFVPSLRASFFRWMLPDAHAISWQLVPRPVMWSGTTMLSDAFWWFAPMSRLQKP